MRKSFFISGSFGLVLAALIMAAFVFSAFGQMSDDIEKLPLNQPLERQIQGGETRQFQFDIKAGEYVRVEVGQKDVDIAVSLFAPDGNLVIEMDGRNGKLWNEAVSVISETGGTYRVEIKTYGTVDLSGSLTVNLAEMRPSSAKDKKRIEAERQFSAGRSLYEQGFAKRKEAVPKFEAAAAGWREIGEKYWEAVTLFNLGFALRDSMKREQAAEIAENGLSIFQEIKDRRGEGRTLNFLGNIYFSLSRHKKAQSNFEQSLTIFRELKDRRNEGVVLNNLGNVHAEINEFDKALSLYKQALIIARETKNRQGESVILGSIGQINMDLDQYEESAEYFEQSLTLAKETSNRIQEAVMTLYLGQIYSKLEQYEKAVKYYEQVLAQTRESKDRQGEAGVLDSLGVIFIKQKRYDKALEYITQSLTITKESKQLGNEAKGLGNLATVYHNQGQFEKAFKYYSQSLELFRQVEDTDNQARTLWNLMLLSDEQKNPRLAVFYGKQAINAFQQVRRNIKEQSKEFKQNFLIKRESAYRRLADILIAEGRLPEAQAVVDLLKEEEFSTVLRRSGNSETSVPYSKAEADALEILDRLAALGREKGELAQKNEQITLTDAEKERFREITKEIETAEAEFNKSITALSSEQNKGKNFDTVVTDAQAFMEDLKNLGRGTVALYTVIVESDNPTVKNEESDAKTEIKTGWIILVTPEFRKAFPIDVKDLERMIFAFRGALLNDRYDPRPVAQGFYKKLFLQKGKDGKTLEADLKEYFKNKPEKTLMWSLDGVLRYIPMAALHDGNTYLVEKYRMTLFNTASKARLKDQPKADWTALGLGVSTAREESGKAFPKLPGAKRELDEIVKEMDGDDGIFNGTIKMDDKFTGEAMQDALFFDKNPVVHIASHFSFNAGNVDESFLLLGKGKMTVMELTAKSTLFTNVDLLALSACDTAVGNSNGKEIEGFAYIAQSLGAKAVLASLWQVSDDGTDELMVRFYDQRSKNPQLPKGEAFRQAQLEMLGGKDLMTKEVSKEKRSGIFTVGNQNINLPEFKKDPNNPFAHPHYWAAFVLIGNWR